MSEPQEHAPDDHRARHAAAERDRRAALQAAGCCIRCGQVRGVAATKTLCAVCAEKQRAASRRYRRNAPSPSPAPFTPPAPNGPVCRYCGNGDLQKNGFRGGRPYFRCRACLRCSDGTPAAAVESLPCPYCKAQCTKKGREKRTGHRRFFCRACGRGNTELYPADPPPPGGPFPHKHTFNLNLAAARRLSEYCNATGQSARQAMRTLFREAAAREAGPGGPFVLASALRNGRPRTDWGDDRTVPGPEPLNLNVRLPNLRAETARAHKQQLGEARYAPTVLGVMQIQLRMDDRAWEGLLRTMKRHDLNQQQAARFLVMNARLPGQVLVATGTRRR